MGIRRCRVAGLEERDTQIKGWCFSDRFVMYSQKFGSNSLNEVRVVTHENHFLILQSRIKVEVIPCLHLLKLYGG